ncbi:hypothetical protein SDC49_15015 [Lactobacillus sp. R2/2]|nr:hypothetical protein [Lactobacillus sp. R2/2]
MTLTKIPAIIPQIIPPISPPFVEKSPAITPAQIAISFKPDICLAATADIITGKPFSMMSKSALVDLGIPGIFDIKSVIAIVIKAGKHAIKIPRKLIFCQIF